MIAMTYYNTLFTEIPYLVEDIKYPQRVHWLKWTHDKVSTGLHYPPHRLGEALLTKQLVDSLRANPAKKTAFILAGGNANFAGMSSGKQGTSLDYEYKFLPMTLTQVYAGRIANILGANDLVYTDASACASSLKVLMDVQTLIKMYGFTRVIVLALEDSINNLVLDFFGEAKASLQLKMETEGKRPSAFDSKNGQFYVGQGGVLAVFESEIGMKDSGFTPIAELLSAYSASEPCSNSIGQLEDGTGFVRAAQTAIDLSGIKNSDIRVVKTHGTGTASNNKAEGNALAHLFKKDFIATSFKPTIGHTLGASGLLETALLLQAMQQNKVPAIKNRTEEDKVYLSEDAIAPEGCILSLAAGMGNIYSAAIFKRV